MKAYSIQVPATTKLFDNYGQSVETRGVRLHMAAETIEQAHALVVATYAHTIGGDPVTHFNTMPANATSQSFAEILGHTSLISGSITIEGGIIIEAPKEIEAFIKASEGDKVRFIRITGATSDISPWRILDALHAIF